jgi:hypothetical protein
MGHAPDSAYGVVPVYGTSAAGTVWWDDFVCGGPPP